ncbi:MAG TPA: lysophospholipid acyltransferase family protein [Actinomycetota bacterium]|nr:lysophospholipid acyltransferase family protein [Actinomycetota bacterium]
MDPIGVRPDHVRDDPWYRAGVWTVGVAAHAALRIRYHGLDNVPRSGGAILASNHISVLDPIVIALGPVRIDRTVRFLAAAEFFERGRHIVAFGLKRFKQIPVRRGKADWQALEEVAAVIRAGSLAGIFPEGRMGDGTALQRGHRGVARIALTAGTPIVPVGIWGTQLRWPREGVRWKRPLRPTVHCVYGPPIEAIGDAHDRREVLDLTHQVMEAIGKSLADAQALF